MTPFAQYVHLTAWFVQHPPPEPEIIKRAIYTRRKGPRIRELLYPLFADGAEYRTCELASMHPDLVYRSIKGALEDMRERGVLGRRDGRWVRGEFYEHEKQNLSLDRT